LSVQYKRDRVGRSEAPEQPAEACLDFLDAHLVYDSPEKVTFRSSRNDEDRLVDLALVKMAGTVLVLVYVERGRDIRVVFFRRASRLERKIYEQALEEQD